jgi:hypothetical protein
MNQNRLLPIHPKPHPTENLLGYVLRLYSMNGCGIPRAFQHLSLLSPMAGSDRMIDRERLSALTLHPASVFDRLGVKVGPSKYEMLGQPVPNVEIRDGDAKFCPACAGEKGFIETHFQLSLMMGCPEHKRRLLSTCPGCKQTLRWARPGIFECDCSYDLSGAELPPISESEALLLEILRRKALVLEQSSSLPTAFPSEHLAKMRLSSLLELIRMLGKFRLFAFGEREVDDDAAVLSAAVVVLNHWPKGIDDLLSDLAFSYRTRRGRSVKTGFDRFSDALLNGALHADMNFIDDAIDNFYKRNRRRLELKCDLRERGWEDRHAPVSASAHLEVFNE